jgi:hypothetical protein
VIRAGARRAWKFLGSPATLIIGILLLAASAVGGNVFQNADRTSQRRDLSEARQQIRDLNEQLDLVKGQQECRSRIASESELYAGRLLANLGNLVVASYQQNDAEGAEAVEEIARATVLLFPALDARLEAVELCEEDPDYRTPFSEQVADPEQTTTTTAEPASRRSTPRRTTSTTTGTTSTTVYPSSPDPSPTPTACALLPGITVPKEIPCP